MNTNEKIDVNQINSTTNEKYLKQELRQAIRIINADYQQIDIEDKTHLTSVLSNVIKNLDAKEVVLCQ